MITFEMETVDQAFDPHAMAWLARYHEEAVRTGVRMFDINNVNQYKTIERQGALRLLVARRDNLQIGFCTCFVMRSNQAAELVGQIDMIYVVPGMRGTMIGMNMVCRLTEQLRKEGVTLFRAFSATKVNSGPLWEWLGFEKVGTIYEKLSPAITH